MSKKSLLLICYTKLVGDARILKQIKLFSEQYELTTCGYGPKPEGAVEHIQIPDEIIFWKRSRLDLILRRYKRAYWNAPVTAYLRKQLAGRQFDIVFTDDLDPVGLGLSLHPRLGLHSDLHEYHPGEKGDVWRWRVFVKPYVKWQLRNFVTKAQTTSCAWDKIRERYDAEYGIKPRVVINATPYHDLKPQPLHSPLRVVHSGIARPDRHLDVTMRAMAAVKRPVQYHLYLTDFCPYRDKLKAIAEELSDETHEICVKDPVPYNELVDTLHKYDVGLVFMPPVNLNNRWALPNKLFDFVQARLALIVLPQLEPRKYVTQYHLGVVTDGFEAADLTKAFDQMDDEQIMQAKLASDAAAPELAGEKVSQGWLECLAELEAAAAARAAGK